LIKTLKSPPNNKVFIVCPPGVKSGRSRIFTELAENLRFTLIQSGNLELLQKTLAINLNLNIEEVDAAGANIVHLAYLYEYYQMGHWLVEMYPALALKPYSEKIPEEGMKIDNRAIIINKAKGIKFLSVILFPIHILLI
jgi:hypothetical protein